MTNNEYDLFKKFNNVIAELEPMLDRAQERIEELEAENEQLGIENRKLLLIVGRDVYLSHGFGDK